MMSEAQQQRCLEKWRKVKNESESKICICVPGEMMTFQTNISSNIEILIFFSHGSSKKLWCGNIEMQCFNIPESKCFRVISGKFDINLYLSELLACLMGAAVQVSHTPILSYGQRLPLDYVSGAALWLCDSRDALHWFNQLGHHGDHRKCRKSQWAQPIAVNGSMMHPNDNSYEAPW